MLWDSFDWRFCVSDAGVFLKTNFLHRVETVGSEDFGHRFGVDDAGDVRRNDGYKMASATGMSIRARYTFTEEEKDADSRED